jgi:excisionase family DNA binding protein
MNTIEQKGAKLAYLTINETALMLGIHPLTVRRWVRKGKIRHKREELYAKVLIPQCEVEQIILNKEDKQNREV